MGLLSSNIRKLFSYLVPMIKFHIRESYSNIQTHSGGRGMLGIPMESKEVTKEALLEVFPTEDVLHAWARGEEAEWPPMEDFDDDQDFERPRLRFEVGQRVACRVGPDPVTGWAPGRVIMLWYREPSWPANSWAPYKIELDDGRNIFAPGDVDQIIRAVDN